MEVFRVLPSESPIRAAGAPPSGVLPTPEPSSVFGKDANYQQADREGRRSKGSFPQGEKPEDRSHATEGHTTDILCMVCSVSGREKRFPIVGLKVRQILLKLCSWMSREETCIKHGARGFSIASIALLAGMISRWLSWLVVWNVCMCRIPTMYLVFDQSENIYAGSLLH